MAYPSQIRIGTRASKLALAQAHQAERLLKQAYPNLMTEIIPITTAGDRELHKTLADWGYKGLFTRELEDALLAEQIDIAVHSVKDMPSALPPELLLAAILPRADVRDGWISPRYASLDDLPQGAIVGTSSTRRAAQLRHVRPDIQIVEFRGTVETRLRKLSEGVADATFLAAAGLDRLGLSSHIRSLLSVEQFLPAAAQGAIGIECLSSREAVIAMLQPLNHEATTICIAAERALLHALDGSCRTAIGALAEVNGDMLTLRAEILSPDGKIRLHDRASGHTHDAAQVGNTLGERLRVQAGEGLLRHG